ncbi:MAG: nucleotide exchange factor GrpE [Phycisphaerales bacterium]|nr:nucleotide exchange factor GrpE [Phycisphaerales bacterium]MCB9854747.1 nucleotide exchange factor GrpE [Phycisphaerales bacterium]
MTIEDNNTTTETPETDGPIGSAGEPQAGATPVDEIESLRQERDELRDRLLRAQAECANISKRLTQQHQNAMKTAGLDLARSMLSVLDNLDRTVDAIPGHDANDALVVGVRMVREELVKALKNHGVAPIEAIGAVFDPMRHEAMLQDFQTDAAAGTVTQELQRGYCMHDRVLRPAKVAVAAAKPVVADSDSTERANEVNDADV